MSNLIAIQEALQRLAVVKLLRSQSRLQLYLVKLVFDDPVQSTTLVNADNLSAVRWPASLFEEPIVFLTKSETEAMFKWERERVSTGLTSLDLEPPYSYKVAPKQFPSKYKVPKFRSSMVINIREHVARFLDLLGSFEMIQNYVFDIEVFNGSNIHLVS